MLAEIQNEDFLEENNLGATGFYEKYLCMRKSDVYSVQACSNRRILTADPPEKGGQETEVFVFTRR